MDPLRSPLPPVAQFLAEAALQRQSSLLGLDRAPAVAPTPPSSSPPLPVPAAPAVPLPVSADKATISAQAREQLGADFVNNPRGAAPMPGARAVLPGPPLPAAPATAWPSTGLSAPLQRLVNTLVQQLTAGAVPQRVVAAQPWPLALAQAWESGAADKDAPPLQTWLVRQGAVQTPEGQQRGFALTLRVPVPWIAAQASPPSPPSAAQAPLRLPFTGPAQSLQSGVFALVLQGAEGQRTSALLVLDFQPQQAATVYGREMLMQARLDPWTQLAVLQASGQVPREEEKTRNGASGLCETRGCPYERRAACVQPFCAALRWVEPSAPLA
jgi:hypothetical protein